MSIFPQGSDQNRSFTRKYPWNAYSPEVPGFGTAGDTREDRQLALSALPTPRGDPRPHPGHMGEAYRPRPTAGRDPVMSKNTNGLVSDGQEARRRSSRQRSRSQTQVNFQLVAVKHGLASREEGLFKGGKPLGADRRQLA